MRKLISRLVVALGGDGQDAADQRGVLGVLERGVAEQRPDRGQPQVAGPGGVAAVGLEVVEEGGDHLVAEVVPAERGGRLAGGGLDVAEQQPQGVPVGLDGPGADSPLADQPVGEERLEGGRDRAHGVTIRAASSRAAALARSSGVAVR